MLRRITIAAGVLGPADRRAGAELFELPPGGKILSWIRKPDGPNLYFTVDIPEGTDVQLYHSGMKVEPVEDQGQPVDAEVAEPISSRKWAASIIPPTIGRKVWLWADHARGLCLDPRQAFDAEVVFACTGSELGFVNLTYKDHVGTVRTIEHVELLAPGADNHHGSDTYATWIPHQWEEALKRHNATPQPVKGNAP